MSFVVGEFPETTVAAPRTPVLRASVNADPCPRSERVSEAAKVGNVTLEGTTR